MKAKNSLGGFGVGHLEGKTNCDLDGRDTSSCKSQAEVEKQEGRVEGTPRFITEFPLGRKEV